MSGHNTRPGGEGGRRALRLPVVHNGQTCYPKLADVDPEGLVLWHRATRENVPLPWLQLVRAGAEAAGLTEEEFAAHLADLVRQSRTPSGLSAHDPVRDHGAAPTA